MPPIYNLPFTQEGGVRPGGAVRIRAAAVEAEPGWGGDAGLGPGPSLPLASGPRLPHMLHPPLPGERPEIPALRLPAALPVSSSRLGSPVRVLRL